MSKGVLLFAFNTEMDYVALAVKSAKRIKEYLNLPVSLVTDSKDSIGDNQDLFDKIFESEDDTTQTRKFNDGSEYSNRYLWKNSNRFSAYELTPYDQTLVIDTDYVLNSSFLLNCFSSKENFLIFKDSYDLAQWRNTSEFRYINQHSIPFYWATVFYFIKDEENRIFFELVKYIKQNWDYYRLIYQVLDKKFRNDYAFSIAIHILNGLHPDVFNKTIPGKMYYTLDKDILINANDNSCTFLVEKASRQGEYTAVKTNNLDVHIMNKYSILRVL